MKNKTLKILKYQLVHDAPILCIIVDDFIVLLHLRCLHGKKQQLLLHLLKKCF